MLESLEVYRNLMVSLTDISSERYGRVSPWIELVVKP